MKFQLKDCRSGKDDYDRFTTVDLSISDNMLMAVFECENSKFYCPYNAYNANHWEGDVCEIFIGTDPNRRQYYEIEVSPNNCIFLAKITNNGEKFFGRKILLEREFVKEPFVKTNIVKNENSYIAKIEIPLDKIQTGNGEIFFNAFRIDTNGGKFLGKKQLLYALNPTKRPKFHTPSKFVKLKDFAI